MSCGGIERLARRAALGLAAFVGAAAAAAQEAPDVPDVISPLRVETDHNGVNLVTGKTRIQVPTLTTPGAPNLRFDRVQNSAPYVKGTINAAGGDGGVSTASFSVHTGLGTEAFQCLDFDCTSVTGTGSTFVQNARRFQQAGTGAIWTFNLKNVDTTTTSNPATVQYYASSVTYPTGERIDYSYDTYTYNGVVYYRPVTVSSNLGYHIALTYQGSTFPSNEWGQVKTASLYHSGTSTLIGQLTYSGVAGGTITDLGGRVFTCSGCDNQLGSSLETPNGSMQLPGEASPTLQVARRTNEPLVASVTRDGVTWNYAYTNLRSEGGYLFDALTVTGPDGFRNIYNYAVWHLSQMENRLVLTGMTDSINRSTSYTFDAAARPIRIVYPEENQVDVGYDEFGNIASRTATPKPNSGLSAVTETALYPTADTTLCNPMFTSSVLCYRPVWSRDGLGRQTDYEYNSAGQLTQQTDPADATGVRRRTIIEYATSATGVSRRSVVRVCGVGTTCGTSQEIRTEYQYWGDTLLPSLVRQVDPATGAALATTFSYDAAGRLLSEDGPLAGDGDATFSRYDVHGRRTWEIGGAGASGARPATRYAYRDSDDKVLQADAGSVPNATSTTLTVLHRTNRGYDNQRNNIFEWVTTGTTIHSFVQRTFQASGRLECEARRMNPAIFGSLPSSACTLGAPGTGVNDFGPDRISRNIYDNAGQLLQVQRAYGITTANGFPQTLQQNYATYTYSLNGQRRTVTDANGNRAELRYDGHDRLVRWVFPSPTTAGALNEADYEAYTWDAAGNRLSLRKRDGKTITFLYDNLNRVTRKTVPASASGAAGYSVFYGYDLRNAQTFARFASTTGNGITNAYDAFGRIISSLNTTGATSRLLQYGYDTGSRRDRLTFPDGQYFRYEYHPNGRLRYIYENAGTTPVATFDYDAAARPTNATVSGAVTTYGYDGVSRLLSLTHNLGSTTHDNTQTFAYNPASQIATRTASNDAYATTGYYDVSRSYSVNGLNQYTAAGPATFAYDANGNLNSDGTNSYVYDAENRLVSASGGSSATLTYDPLGRLWRTVGGGVTRQFLYDGDELVAEYGGSGNTPLRRWVHGIGTDDPVLWYEGSAVSATTRRGLLANHQGSIVAVGNDSGNMVAVNGYDAWGIPNTGNQTLGRFGYTGQIWMPEIGMWYYKARLYSPTLGRFLQTDSVGYEDDVNLYAYVGNDPVSATDPTGNYQCKPGEECRQVEVARRQMIRARENLRNSTGTRIESRASQHLGRLINHLGTENDGRGPTVEMGSLGGPFGHHDSETDTITLDREAIARDSRATMGGVLAHETSHSYDDSIGRTYDLFASEILADTATALVEIGLQHRGFFWRPGIGRAGLIRAIKGGAMRYCRARGPFIAQCQASIERVYPSIPAFD